jgi:hypothetical protein
MLKSTHKLRLSQILCLPAVEEWPDFHRISDDFWPTRCVWSPIALYITRRIAMEMVFLLKMTELPVQSKKAIYSFRRTSASMPGKRSTSEICMKTSPTTMAKGSSEYFLGSIVVAKHLKGGHAVYDGQQRLGSSIWRNWRSKHGPSSQRRQMALETRS